MRVLVFAHDSELYGASQSLLTALQFLATQKENELLVLLPYSGKLAPVMERMNIPYQVVPYPRCTVQVKHHYSLWRKLRDIRNFYNRTNTAFGQVTTIVQQFRPDIIYTNTSVISIGYKAARKFNIPHVWHIREFGWPDYRLKYLPNKQAVTSAIRSSAGAIFISKSLRTYWLKQQNGNSMVIYNGIVNGIGTTQLKKIPEGPINIGILGAIVPGKGQHVAIRAFHHFLQRHANSYLQVYGDVNDREYYESLRTLCQQLQLEDRVRFNGFVEDKDRIFESMNLLLNCSVMEGFGRSIVEAMSRGIPVIASAGGGVPEIIDDSVNGFLYNQEKELHEKMLRLFGEEHLYESISRGALEKSLHYSVDTYAHSIQNTFKQAVTNKQLSM